ncbi:MAG: CHAT domain-containing protein [Alphaproteobacteria bacterium]|nr:CHAT domain-containing protein [Alphaproteobacteria bacterium]
MPLPSPITTDPLELALEFGRGGDRLPEGEALRGYVLRHGAGRYRAATLLWDTELRALLRAVGRRGAGEARARLAERLLRFLEAAGWEAMAQSLVEALAEAREARLDFISNAPELYALPWELLPVGDSGQALGELPGTLLRYRWPGTRTAALAPAQARWRTEGRALLASAGADVPAQAQAEAAREALGERLSLLPGLSRAGLDDALRAAAREGAPFSTLQLLCHGGPGPQGQRLDWEDGPIDPEELQALLSPHAATLRLVVLSACAGGGVADAGSRLGDHARAVHRGSEALGGVQAVIASRLLLSSPGSVEMTRALYRALGAGLGVEGAFLEARDALITRSRRGADPEHVTLQLLSRGDEVLGAPDGDGLLLAQLRGGRRRLELTAQGRRWRVQGLLTAPSALLRAGAEVSEPWLAPFLGEALGAALLPDGAQELLEAAEAWSQGQGAPLRLHVEAEGAWAALPWEQARLPGLGAPLTVSVRRGAAP